MSTAYTYSKTTDFPNGINTGQLIQEITAVIVTPFLYDISVNADVVTIAFSASLLDVSVLNNVVNNHVPIIYDYINPYLLNNVLTNTINSTELQYFGNNRREIIISQDGQSYYSSLGAAVSANSSPNQIFVIFPGTYVENNPIVLPAGSSVVAKGSATTTMLVAQNPAADLMILNTKCKISGITFYGAYGAGSRGIYFDAAQGTTSQFCILNECFIIDCNIALECDGKNDTIIDTVYADKLIVGVQNLSTSKGVYCHSHGQFIGTACYVFGVQGTHSVAQAYTCENLHSKISLITASSWYNNIGVYVDNFAEAEISLLNIQYNDVGVTVGPNGTATRLSATSLIIRNSTTYDVDIQATSANVQIYSSFLDDVKLNNPNDVNITVRYNAAKFGNYYQTLIGDIQVGSPFQPSKFAAGEGLFVNSNIVVFSNDNLEVGTWVNNTNIALLSDGTPFNIFQTTASNNCMYLGSTKTIFGLKLSILTALVSVVPQSDLQWEYWNGSSWISFNVMQTYPDTRHTYIPSFLSLQSKFHIRFGLNFSTPFANKTLNGIAKNWVRLRVINTLPSLPTGNYVKIHTNASVINNDGFIEYFGSGRVFCNSTVLTYPDPTLALPSSQSIFLAPSLSLTKTYNVFPPSIITRVGFGFKIPVNLDISFPMKYNISFVCDNSATGDILWTFRYTYATDNTPLYLLDADAQLNPNPDVVTITQITTIPANNQRLNLYQVIPIDCSKINSNISTINKYFFYGTLERTGNSGSDTYIGNISLINLDYDYITWTPGGHLSEF